MKKIFLCSSFADVASILSESVSVPLRGKTVAFIPTASIHEEYTQYVEDGKVALDSLGLIVKELEITQCSKNEMVGFYPVVHFDSFPFEEAAREVVNKNSHLPLKIITNQQAIAVVGNSIVIKERK